jgi:hypothetical protein
MRIEQSFGPSPTGGLWLQYTAVVSGTTFCVREVIGEYKMHHAHIPIALLTRDMRRQLMQEIESSLFRGVP